MRGTIALTGLLIQNSLWMIAEKPMPWILLILNTAFIIGCAIRGARYANETFKSVKDFNGSVTTVINQLLGLPPKP